MPLPSGLEDYLYLIFVTICTSYLLMLNFGIEFTL